MGNTKWCIYKLKTDLSVPLRCSRVTVKIACEREDAAFIAVEPTVRAEFPSSRQLTISLAETTCRSVNPTIWKTAVFRDRSSACASADMQKNQTSLNYTGLIWTITVQTDSSQCAEGYKGLLTCGIWCLMWLEIWINMLICPWIN